MDAIPGNAAEGYFVGHVVADDDVCVSLFETAIALMGDDLNDRNCRFGQLVTEGAPANGNLPDMTCFRGVRVHRVATTRFGRSSSDRTTPDRWLIADKLAGGGMIGEKNRLRKIMRFIGIRGSGDRHV